MLVHGSLSVLSGQMSLKPESRRAAVAVPGSEGQGSPCLGLRREEAVGWQGGTPQPEAMAARAPAARVFL